ncbi:MAG: hypothetical protein JSR76_04310 [Verrucomicrobia bacterium]|nr:hypothetical protein [Verrucomicrobiota bacterium]
MSTTTNPSSTYEPDHAATSVPGIGDGTGGGWDPDAVQEQIMQQILQAKEMLAKGQDPSVVLYYIGFLMQEYGLQKVGQQAEIQDHINKYFGEIQDAWNLIHSANGDASASGTDFTGKFEDLIGKISAELQGDTFFDGSPDRQAMRTQIIDNLSSLVGTVDAIPAGPGQDKLWYMWQIYNDDSTTVPGFTGDRTASMTVLNQQMTEFRQQIGGVSDTVSAVTKAEMQTLQASQDVMNNFGKAMSKLLTYLNQQQRTG